MEAGTDVGAELLRNGGRRLDRTQRLEATHVVLLAARIAGCSELLYQRGELFGLIFFPHLERLAEARDAIELGDGAFDRQATEDRFEQRAAHFAIDRHLEAVEIRARFREIARERAARMSEAMDVELVVGAAFEPARHERGGAFIGVRAFADLARSFRPGLRILVTELEEEGVERSRRHSIDRNLTQDPRLYPRARFWTLFRTHPRWSTFGSMMTRALVLLPFPLLFFAACSSGGNDE